VGVSTRKLCSLFFLSRRESLPRLSFEASSVLHPALEARPGIRVANLQLAAQGVERPAVVGVVGHGHAAAVGVGIGEERARVEALVVHERFAVAA